MKRLLLVAVTILVLGGILLGLGIGCAPEAKGKLVGTGSFGVRNEFLRGIFSVYVMNIYDEGDIIIDKLIVIEEDGAVALELMPGDIKTPGDDNILAPNESWEFVVEQYLEEPDAKLTYSAAVYWHAEEPNTELAGWFYQKIIFYDTSTDPKSFLDLSLVMVPMVNVPD